MKNVLHNLPQYPPNPPPPNLTTDSETMSTLLLIDPQVDFHPGGSLAIPNASSDAVRVKAFLSTDKVKDLIVTMDSHHKFDIAHPGSWIVESSGKHPDPFTIITNEEVVAGKYRPVDGDKEWAEAYTKALEDGDRFKLCIWVSYLFIYDLLIFDLIVYS